MKVGYRRVSTSEQNLDRQELSGVNRIFEDKATGKNTDRVALQEMIAFVRSGDEVIVHSIDRLAQDLRDLQGIINALNDKDVSVEFLSERLLFSGSDLAVFVAVAASPARLLPMVPLEALLTFAAAARSLG